MVVLIALLGCQEPGAKDSAAALDSEDCTPFEWFLDGDGDGYGDVVVVGCIAPEGATGHGGDCDDSDPTVHPGADEDCTEDLDRNCDGDTEHADVDGDGFAACVDCDDGAAAIHPDADELCDLLDNDCDGEVDEDDALDAESYFADTDVDGYGDPEVVVYACSRPYDATRDNTDCDDTNPSVHPGAEEVCDGLDTDCDQGVGETLVPTDIATVDEAIAGAVDGDAFCLEAGTYTGSVDLLGKAITLEGAGGSGQVVLENPGGRVVFIEGAEGAALVGLSLQRGQVTDALGAGLYISDSEVTLRDVELAFHSTAGSSDGGVLSVWNSTVILDGVEVRDNETAHDTDIAYALAPVHFVGSSVSGSGLDVHDNEVIATEVVGGAVLAWQTDVSLDEVSIEDNAAYGEFVWGSAFYAQGEALGYTVELSNTVFANNTGEAYGLSYGTVTLAGLSDVTLSGVTIEGNQDQGDAYGAYAPLWLDENDSATLSNVAVQDNWTSGESVIAGAIFADQTEVEATNVLVFGNETAAVDTHYGAVVDFHPAGASAWTNVSVHGNSVSGASTVLGAGWTCIDVVTDLTNVTITQNEAPSVAQAGGLQGVGLNNDGCDMDFTYGNVWDNDGADWGDGLTDPTGTDGVLSVDPGFTDVSGADPATWDLSLSSASPLVDAGHPALVDADASACDIGAYGGPGGSGW